MKSNWIIVRYSRPDGTIESATYTTAVLEDWMTDPDCIDIMSCETGEMLYIKDEEC